MKNNVYKLKISDVDLKKIEERVNRVNILNQNATKAWLEIAREFGEAKDKLSPLAFDRFVNDVGVTNAVAVKLISIASKNVLYREEYLPYVATLHGWTVVYELSKLDDATVGKVIDELKADPAKRLTREIIESYSTKNKAPKMLMIASVEIDEQSAENITDDQLKRFQSQFDVLKQELNKLNAHFTFKEPKSGLKTLQEAANANNSPELVQTAA